MNTTAAQTAVIPLFEGKEFRAITDFAKFVADIVPGVRKDLLAVKTAEIVRDQTGYDMTELRHALPAPKDEEIEKLNPTQVGDLCGLSAREVNKASGHLDHFVDDRDDIAWLTPEKVAKLREIIVFIAGNGGAR